MAEEKKNPIAQALTALRNKKLTPEQRSEIARKAAAARWKDNPPVKGGKGKKAGK